MFDYLFISIQIFPLTSVLAIGTSIASKKLGNYAAVIVALSLSILLGLTIAFLWINTGDIASRLLSAFSTAVILSAIVYLPMTFFGATGRLKQMVVVGVMGAGVASLVAPIVGISIACQVFRDCL